MHRLQLEELIQHMEWADSLVWSAVLASPKSTLDPVLHGRIYHIHSVQHAFLQIWRGEELDLPELSSFQDAASLREWAREYYFRMKPFFSAMDETALDRLIQLPWNSRLEERYGKVHPVSLVETILQVVTHATYHRGQVNTRLREIGGNPPLTDFIAWIWSGKADPDWPS